jgi:hypothetical protein
MAEHERNARSADPGGGAVHQVRKAPLLDPVLASAGCSTAGGGRSGRFRVLGPFYSLSDENFSPVSSRRGSSIRVLRSSRLGGRTFVLVFPAGLAVKGFRGL